jgi:hypothetical protein
VFLLFGQGVGLQYGQLPRLPARRTLRPFRPTEKVSKLRTDAGARFAAIAGKEDKNKKSKSKSNGPSTAEPAS